jgi:hypothetical protein
MADDQDDFFAPIPITKASPRKPPSRVKRRLLESAAAIATEDPDSLLFQHTVFCQVGLPYRDPGDAIREWERKQGAVSLFVEAGRARHPGTGEWVKLGLPWGPKPRLILAHFNTEALRTGSPEIDVGDSLTAFVERVRGFKHGREIRAFKEQLGRLSAALVRLAVTRDGRSLQVKRPDRHRLRPVVPQGSATAGAVAVDGVPLAGLLSEFAEARGAARRTGASGPCALGDGP